MSMAVVFENLKAHTQWNISINKATLYNPSQTVPLTDKQVLFSLLLIEVAMKIILRLGVTTTSGTVLKGALGRLRTTALKYLFYFGPNWRQFLQGLMQPEAWLSSVATHGGYPKFTKAFDPEMGDSWTVVGCD